jgi:hypothetical protein
MLGEPKPEQGMPLRRRSPPSLVEGEWESVPPVQFVKVVGDDSTTIDVSLHELTKKVALRLHMASPLYWGIARVPVPSTPSSSQRRPLALTAMVVPSIELTFAP